MSITLKHLDGPLKGERVFDDGTTTILVGRAPEAQIVYPEECIEVDGEHLKLNRDAAGAYSIELCGSCDVELDGKPAESGVTVAPGSVVTVGLGGPRFACFPSGAIIRHSAGPLAGQQHYFPDGVETISFGRPPEQTEVSYPDGYTKIGRRHFSLKRTKQGDYCVELTPKHYVELDGVEADNGVLAHSGSSFRLGGDQGPSFTLTIEKPQQAGQVTEENKVQTPIRKELHKTSKDLAGAKKVGAYALGTLAAALLVLGGLDYYRDIRHQQDLARLATDLIAAGDRVSAIAADEIQGAASKARNAVYLVARKEGANETGQATAWAFEPDRLATNAHVTEAIKGHEKEFLLIAPNGERIAIDRVESHPGYLAFKAYKATQGRMSGDSFKPLDVINEYDVGIIYPAGALPVDPGTGAPATLSLANEDEIAALEPAEAVAMVGFPIEGLAASMVATEAPSTVQFGYISRLTDVFMCRADPAHQLLIQHSVPVTGGVSGSPLIDKNGKVIGIVNGGNTASVLKTAAAKDKDADDDKAKTEEAAQPETSRIPNAALINFAQRIDLLDDLNTGAAAQELAADEDYWDQAAKKFVNYFASATKDFVALAAERYGVSGAKQKEIGSGTLTPRKPGATSFVSASHHYVLEPGRVYGFIADGKSGVRVGLNVKKEGSAEFLRDAKDPRQTSVPELAPTAWVTVDKTTPVDIDVWSLTAQPADYVLHVYDWDSQAGQAEEASSTAPSQ
jgi:hypothetical protein